MSFCDYWFTVAFESQSAILLAVSEAGELVPGLNERGASKKSPCYRQVHDKIDGYLLGSLLTKWVEEVAMEHMSYLQRDTKIV